MQANTISNANRNAISGWRKNYAFKRLNQLFSCFYRFPSTPCERWMSDEAMRKKKFRTLKKFFFSFFFPFFDFCNKIPVRPNTMGSGYVKWGEEKSCLRIFRWYFRELFMMKLARAPLTIKLA